MVSCVCVHIEMCERRNSVFMVMLGCCCCRRRRRRHQSEQPNENHFSWSGFGDGNRCCWIVVFIWFHRMFGAFSIYLGSNVMTSIRRKLVFCYLGFSSFIILSNRFCFEYAMQEPPNWMHRHVNVFFTSETIITILVACSGSDGEISYPNELTAKWLEAVDPITPYWRRELNKWAIFKHHSNVNNGNKTKNPRESFEIFPLLSDYLLFFISPFYRISRHPFAMTCQ